MGRRAAVIDIGTNSVKLLVAERTEEGIVALEDDVMITKLGEDLARTGMISKEASARSCSAVARMYAAAKAHAVDDIAVIGTECLRRAANADDFTRAVRDMCGEHVDVIGGDLEASLSYAAAMIGIGGACDAREMCFFDIGGGSSEVAFGTREALSESVSLPVGALVLHSGFFEDVEGVVPLGLVDDAITHVVHVYESEAALADLRASGCAAAGGSVVTIAAVMAGVEDHRAPVLRGARVSIDEVDRQIELYASTPVRERASIVGVPQARADTILAGACVMRALMEACGVDGAFVSTKGLRWGAIVKMLDAS